MSTDGFLDGCRAEYEAGNKVALMQAIHVCGIDRIPLPDWVASAYSRCFESVRMARAKSWDDVFGKPFPKGSNLIAIHKRRKHQWDLVNRIRLIRESEPGTALDAALFERVGKEFGLGRSLAQDYYYEAKQHADRYGLWE